MLNDFYQVRFKGAFPGQDCSFLVAVVNNRPMLVRNEDGSETEAEMFDQLEKSMLLDPKAWQKVREVSVESGYPGLFDPVVSVLNCHFNNALNRTKTAFIKRFGQKAFDAELKPIVDEGLRATAIFDESPNQFTGWFIETLMVFVNEGQRPSKKQRDDLDEEYQSQS